jgi:signal transduction histidine kinase
LFVCAARSSQHLLHAAREQGRAPGATSDLAEQIKKLREEALRQARKAVEISRTCLEVRREQFRAYRILAEVLGCASDRRSPSAAEADPRFAEAKRWLAVAGDLAAELEEPFAVGLWRLTAAAIHEHHGDVQEAAAHYRASLDELQKHPTGYRLHELHLRYGQFLRRRESAEDRWHGLGLLAHGRRLARKVGNQALVRAHEDALRQAPAEELTEALADAWSRTAEGAEFASGRAQLCDGLRHDIGNTLAAIPERAGDPGALRAWVDHAHGLVTFLSQVAALPALPRLDGERFALREAVESLLARHRSGPHGVALRNDVPDSVFVFADRRLLDRALDNLVHNALKAIPADFQDRRVVVTAEEQPGILEITVADTGTGIDDFDPETHLPSRRGGGLTFTDWIVHQHGGVLWAKPGAGTTFIVRLPRPDGAA